MYVILKFPGVWALYNARTQSSKPLTPEEIEVIQRLYADDLNPNAVFDALQVEPIAPGKLQKLTIAVPSNQPTKKPTST